jgi:hypothetical protein
VWVIKAAEVVIAITSMRPGKRILAWAPNFE